MNISKAAVSRWSAFAVVAGMLSACAGRPAVTLDEQDQRTLHDVEAYLNGLDRLDARFVQTGADGTAEGEMWLDRPGRLRMDYRSPQPKTVVADDGWLTISDQSTGGSTTLPVSNTPLGMLLREHVVLSGQVEVTSLRQQGGVLRLTLVRRDAPNRGSLSLDFRQGPLALVAVAITDAHGRTDDLALSHVERPTRIDASTFEHRPPPAPG